MLKPILLVEDNPRDLELTLLALERSQLANEVIVLRDGAEALDYLLRRNAYAERDDGNPAVLLLDLKLPKVDGLEVLKEVRATAELRSIPTVMLTSSREDARPAARLRAGGERVRGQAGGVQGIRRRHFRPGGVLGGTQRTATRLAAPEPAWQHLRWPRRCSQRR
ncbi:response regulator receiver protein [Pseudomonas putida S11]|nr:response regulator receiver protein [Pseudomonas putida S11]